jgi:eukaryotic-like serine/threonine-protein kinase
MRRRQNTGKAKKRKSENKDARILASPRALPFISSQLKGDLDNIILTALRKEPARRYASAQDLSDDISNYLNGLPVAARPNTFFYRAAKFYRRNRTASVIGIFLAMSLISGIIATSWQAIAARQQRDRAEKRFQDVRKLSNSLLFEITPKIERLPGSTEAREIIINRALEYLDDLAAESENDHGLQSELAAAYEKIGDLQGNPTNPNLIMLDDAIQSFEKANKIRQKLLLLNSDDRENKIKIAENYRLLGGVYGQTNDYETEQRHLQTAAEMYEKLLAENSASAGLQIALAQTNYDMGVGQTSLKSYGAAIPFYNKAIKVLENLLINEPQNIEAKRLLGIAYAQKSYSLSWEDRQPEAETEIARAIAISEKLFAENPADARVRDSLRLIYWLAGNINEEINDQLFYEYQTKAARVARETVKTDSADLRARQMLAKTLSHLGQAAINVGRVGEAIGHLEESSRYYREIVESKTRSSRLKAELAASLLRLGAARARDGDLEKGIESLQEAEKTYREIIQQFPFDKRSGNNLASAYAAIAGVYESNQNKIPHAAQLARINYEKALDVMLRLEKQDVLSEYDRKFLEEIKKSLEKFSAL